MKFSLLIIVVVLLVACSNIENKEIIGESNNDKLSPYAGQEIREIKSLSENEIEGLKEGRGTPFGGMAKLAELNGYPGPIHVLDLSDEVELSENQVSQIERIYNEMNSDAILLGEIIIAIEQEMDNKFKDGSMTEEYLKEKVEESARVYGQLRYTHLKAHLSMIDMLTPDQVHKYNELRGYNSNEDPCVNIPEGHSPEMWKIHHGCE